MSAVILQFRAATEASGLAVPIEDDAAESQANSNPISITDRRAKKNTRGHAHPLEVLAVELRAEAARALHRADRLRAEVKVDQLKIFADAARARSIDATAAAARLRLRLNVEAE